MRVGAHLRASHSSAPDATAGSSPAEAPAPRFRVLEDGIDSGLRRKLEGFLSANGTEVARHRGGFTPFAADLSTVPGVGPGAEVEIVVRAADGPEASVAEALALVRRSLDAEARAVLDKNA